MINRENIYSLIVCVLESEYSGFQNALKKYNYNIKAKKIGIISIFEIIIDSVQEIKIILSLIPRKGELDNTTHMSSFLDYFNPSYLFLIGIAGGLSNKVNIGDIIVADTLTYYEPKKVVDKPIQRPKSWSTPTELLQNLRHFYMDQFKKNFNIKVEFGLLLSGEKTIANVELKKELINIYPDVLGVEMEGAGFMQAIEQKARSSFYTIVKAVSDKSDESKDKINQEESAKNASLFVLEFLIYD